MHNDLWVPLDRTFLSTLFGSIDGVSCGPDAVLTSKRYDASPEVCEPFTSLACPLRGAVSQHGADYSCNSAHHEAPAEDGGSPTCIDNLESVYSPSSLKTERTACQPSYVSAFTGFVCVAPPPRQKRPGRRYARGDDGLGAQWRTARQLYHQRREEAAVSRPSSVIGNYSTSASVEVGSHAPLAGPHQEPRPCSAAGTYASTPSVSSRTRRPMSSQRPRPASWGVPIVSGSGLRAARSARCEPQTPSPKSYGAAASTQHVRSLAAADAVQELEAQLFELRQRPMEERRLVLRDLLRQWHPDKNLERASEATHVFQWLQTQKLDVLGHPQEDALVE